MTRLIALFLIASASPAFTDQPPKDPPKETPSESVPQSDDGDKLLPDPSGRPYFPKGSGNETAEWWDPSNTRLLAKMKEPSLFDQGDKRPELEVRFLWLRSFHDPISVRVWTTPEGSFIRTARIKKNQEEPSLPGTLVETTRVLDAAETKSFTEALTKAPLAAPMNETEKTLPGGLDGAEWIFESYMEKKYQMLNFWGLNAVDLTRYRNLGVDTSKLRDTSSLLKFALTLLKLSKLNIPKEDIY
jgi:hypothetical protein